MFLLRVQYVDVALAKLNQYLYVKFTSTVCGTRACQNNGSFSDLNSRPYSDTGFSFWSGFGLTLKALWRGVMCCGVMRCGVVL